MAEKMNRRAFMKGAAAAAVAVSLSGVLAGCGKDDGYDVGDFRVYPTLVAAPWDSINGTGSIKLNVKVKNMRTTVSLSNRFEDVFQASVGEQKLELTNAVKGNTINLLKDTSKDCALEFVVNDNDIFTKLISGEELMTLTIKLSSQSRKFAVSVKEKQVAPVEELAQ